MKTKRKYAHELYPHADEDEVRSLEIEVPYLYAQAIGHAVFGTGWFDAPWRNNQWASLATVGRTMRLIDLRQQALLADALLQDLVGQEAWEWAASRCDEGGEWVYERAVHYGVPIDQIKSYPCGPEPDHHQHLGDLIPQVGCRESIRVQGKESECADCCEPEVTS